MSYHAKALYIRANRRRKKRSDPDIRPEYRLELVSVNSAELASVVAKEFGEILQNAGVEISVSRGCTHMVVKTTVSQNGPQMCQKCSRSDQKHSLDTPKCFGTGI